MCIRIRQVENYIFGSSLILTYKYILFTVLVLHYYYDYDYYPNSEGVFVCLCVCVPNFQASDGVMDELSVGSVPDLNRRVP